MYSSVNYDELSTTFIDSNESFEQPYGCTETNVSIEKIYNMIQAYKAGFNDREYKFDY